MIKLNRTWIKNLSGRNKNSLLKKKKSRNLLGDQEPPHVQDHSIEFKLCDVILSVSSFHVIGHNHI